MTRRRARTEDSLRNHIKSILEALKEPEERVLDVHGSSEHGLDLVVLKRDLFGVLRAYGIQIKTGDIRCSGKPTQRIKEIIGQFCIAFGKPVNVDGREYKLDGFYLVTDGEFSGNAEMYIRSACIGIRSLHFVDGQSLNEFITKHKPQTGRYKET